MASMAYLRTLGRTELEVSGRVIPLTIREARLMAYLCTRRGFRTSRREVARLFWPRSTMPKARHSFSQLIYALRGKVGTRVLITQGDVIAVGNVRADFVELIKDVAEGRYLEAHGRYGGRFLSGDDTHSSDLQDWCDRIDRDTAHAVADAIKEQAFACGSGELASVIQIARDLISAYPRLTSARVALLEALARSGHVREVEYVYNDFVREGVGDSIPPLESFIGRRTTLLQDGAVRFTGRSNELAMLQRYWELAEAGQGQVVVIYGEPGIGKTRLADHFLRRVAINGGSTWIARCCAVTQRLPYAVVTELIRDNPAGVRSSEGQAVIDHLETMGESGVATTDENRHRLTECVTGMLLRQSAIRPLAILIDDAQWADDYTALLVSYWAYRLKDHRVMILLAVRTHDVDPQPSWIDSDLGYAASLVLGRVSVEAATEMAAGYERSIGISIDKSLREAAIWRSAGRPFLLLEALRTAAMAEEGSASPSTILSVSSESLLRRRFRNLPQEAETTLGVLAVWGRAIPQAALQTLSDLSEKALATALNVLHERGIATWNNGLIAFVHDLMREAAQRSLAPGTQSLLHRRIAAYLANAGEAFGLIAVHYASGGDGRKAAAYAAKAALDAFAVHSYTDFEYYCRMVIEHGDTEQQVSAVDILSKYLVQVGRTAEIADIRHPLVHDRSGHGILNAISRLEHELAQGTQDADQLLRLAQGIIHDANQATDASIAPIIATVLDVVLDTGSVERGSEIIGVLRKAVRAGDHVETHLAIGAIAAVWHGVTEGSDEAIVTAEGIVSSLDESISLPIRALCLTAYGTLLLLGGKIVQAIDCFGPALGLAIQAGDVRRQMAIHNNNGVALLEAGHVEAARQCFDRVLTSSNVHSRVRGFGNLAILHYECGDTANAKRLAEVVLSMNKTYKSRIVERLGHALCGLIELSEGDLEAAQDRNTRVEAVQSTAHVGMDVGYVAILACRLQAMRGDIEGAVRCVDEAVTEIGSRDVLCVQRLLCEKAGILESVDPEVSAMISRSVQKRALEWGANLIADRARRTMHIRDFRG